jgi:uncharacterized cupin superfamily protein
MNDRPIHAASVYAPPGKTHYPAPYVALVAGRVKRRLGDLFGLTNFGVNLTELGPGAASSVPHRHSKQDEFVYVLAGTPTLVVDNVEFVLRPGECYGFKAGNGRAHQLVNRTAERAAYLEIGDRSGGDEVEYPGSDLRAAQRADGSWSFTRKDGGAFS